MREHLILLERGKSSSANSIRESLMKETSDYYNKVKQFFRRKVTLYWRQGTATVLCSVVVVILFAFLYWKKKLPTEGSQISFLSFATIMALLCLAVIVLPLFVGLRHFASVKLKDKDIFLLETLLVIYAGISFWTSNIQVQISGERLASKIFPFGNDFDLLTLAIPVIAAPMIITTFFNVAVGYLFSFALCFVITFLARGSLWVFIYFFLSSVLGAHLLHPYHDRVKPIRTGLWVGLFQTIFVVISLLLVGISDWSYYVSYIGVVLLSAILAGVLASGFIPLVEYLFGYTTDMRLMELASMDHPLLRELMIQAPGTYHHSLIVGTMAESAAKAIGAHGLLAKVAGYYHDIGKIKKPLYFIENQFGCENRHEKLAPSMSSLILISHVKDGVELARHYKLGQPIIDIIQQHHGTNLIAYFYHKALELRSKVKQHKKGVELPPVNIEDYRYPGPKPQTKEAGLVMLADITEAACRSLPNPTPARIQGMVSKLINQAFTDGQLDSCELTLKDLHQIAKRFYQILAAIHHKRIEYPQQMSESKKGVADERSNDSKRTSGSGDRPGEAEKVSQPYLKRLGL